MKLIEKLRALPPKQKWLLIGGAAAALVLVVGLILLLTLGGGKQPAGGDASYTVEVANEAGTPLPGVEVYLYRDKSLSDLINFAKTDEAGRVTFTTDATGCVVVLESVPAGYEAEAYYALSGETTRIVLKAVLQTDVDLSKVTYRLGDMIHDFKFTDGAGKEYVLSQLLQEKKAVVLNFWYTNCGPCASEFPYLQTAYDKYKDSIALLAVDPGVGGDDNAAVAQFATTHNLTFPMMVCDPAWANAMQIAGYPTTVVIDRYGMITFVHTGAITEAETFETIFAFYGAEEYTQTVADSVDDLSAALSGSTDTSDTSDTSDTGTGDGTSADSPIEIGGTLEFDASVPAGGKTYYHVYKVSGTTLTIQSKDAYVEYEGKTYNAQNGTVSVPVTSPDVNTPVKLAIGNNGSSAATFKVFFTYPGGTLSNPFELKMGDLTTNIQKGNDQGVVYTYTATDNGTVEMYVTSATSGVRYDFVLYNLNTYANRTLDEDAEEANGRQVVSVAVNKGDVLQVTVSVLPDENNEYPAATIKSNLTFKKSSGPTTSAKPKDVTYSATVKDTDGKAVSGVSLQFAVGDSKKSATTNASGAASAVLPFGDCTVTVTVPAGYIAERLSYTMNAVQPSVQIVLEKEPEQDVSEGTVPTDYTVKVLDGSGKPQTGVTVQFYLGDEKKAEQKVDSQGVAKVTLTDATYTIRLTGTDLRYDQKAAVVSVSAPSVELLLAPYYSKDAYELVGDPATGKNVRAYFVTAGTMYVDLKPGERNYFLFAPEEPGTYRITTTSTYAKVGYYGGSVHFVQANNLAEDLTNNAFTVSAREVGPTFVLGVDAATNISGTIMHVTRIGDPEWSIADEPWHEYTATHTPKPYTLTLGSGQSLTNFDLTADKYTLVYNDSDGFYHLDSKTGPVVYLRFNDKAPYISFQQILSSFHISAYLYDTNGDFLRKEEYTACVQEYVNNMDSTHGVYPLTKDLEYILKQYGKHQGWWDPNSPTYLFAEAGDVNLDLAWMFALCYVK
ncbi:MAG: redoxin family protein [Clostridia bacterium]|nr:redoxin family protein [Clostridia bacterium]